MKILDCDRVQAFIKAILTKSLLLNLKIIVPYNTFRPLNELAYNDVGNKSFTYFYLLCNQPKKIFSIFNDMLTFSYLIDAICLCDIFLSLFSSPQDGTEISKIW